MGDPWIRELDLGVTSLGGEGCVRYHKNSDLRSIQGRCVSLSSQCPRSGSDFQGGGGGGPSQSGLKGTRCLGSVELVWKSVCNRFL